MDQVVLFLALLFGLPVGQSSGASDSVTIALGPSALPARALALPLILGPKGLNRPLVVIDPGHGGSNHGATGVVDGVVEKAVTLAVVAPLVRALE